MRISEKDITLSGRRFILRKFTPQAGCYWAFRLFGTVGISLDQAVIIHKIVEFVKMERDQFEQLQRDCLFHVVEPLAAGAVPVMDERGQFRVENVDGPLAFQLTLASFAFSISDFFTEEVLTTMIDQFSGLFFNDVTTESTNSSTPPSGTDTGNSTNSGTAPIP